MHTFSTLYKKMFRQLLFPYGYKLHKSLFYKEINQEQCFFITAKKERYAPYYTVYLDMLATVYKGNIIKNLIMDCQSYTKYRPNETTGGIFVSWRRKEELPTGA